ncbi:MAG TPA: PIN domain-containing protein [Methylomirabilota bacterium]|nr:PIN domain-containing protein [Methylomirabilota bacterium]
MTAFPDTSFLFALYRAQDNSAAARKHYDAMTEALTISGLLAFEFRQSMRFQAWLHAQDSRKGVPAAEAEHSLSDLDANLASGALEIATVDWADVHRIAERLSATYTKANGHRAIDVLHVATALHLGVEELLTFDGNQRKLATAEGLKVKP